MRFFIKAYPMHEHEVLAVQQEADHGLVEAEVHEGLIEGIADESAIGRLADQGVVVQAIARVPEATPTIAESGSTIESVPSDAASGDRREASSTRTQGMREITLERLSDPESTAEYWLVTLLGGLSDRTVSALADNGADIVERDPSGALVVRTTDVARLGALPFVGNVRPYGPQETLDGAVSMLRDAEPSRAEGRPMLASRGGLLSLESSRAIAPREPNAPSAGQFEAICHRREDRPQVKLGIETLGGTTTGGAGRVIRFILNRADIDAVAALPGVASVSRSSPARLLVERARPLIGLEQAGPASSSLPYDGAGELVGVADTGIDTFHPDFATKRIVAIPLGRPGDSSDPDGHGTHVAGTIVGDGSASRPAGAGLGIAAPLRGVAPAAGLYFQSLLDANGGLGGLPDALGDLFEAAYAAGVRVHNNSWGAYIQGRYDSMSLDVDEFVFSHPDFLPVIAAGNEGSCLPGFQAQTGFVDYPSLGAPATAKNGLTVGASRSDRAEGGYATLRWEQAWPEDFNQNPIASVTISGDPQGLAAFSSRGPCDDMRIKPDVVAPGTDIASTRSRDAPLANFWGAYPKNRHYAFMGGTSMACPIVTGCAALVRQYYRQQRGHAVPSAALLKATLINGAQALAGADATAAPVGIPNYHQGFGKVDLTRTLPDPTNPAFEVFFVDTWNRDPALRFTSRSARRRWEFSMTQPGELRIAVTWTDSPARGLQNQLRIILDTRRSGRTINWIGNEQASAPLKVPAHDPRTLLPGQTTVLTRDPQNNAQVIRADVEPGSYTLALFADSLIQLPQDFALVATFPTGGAQVTPR